MKPIHAYRTTGVRVIRGGYPIVSECGHINGVAFGEVLKVEEDLKDSPSHDTATRMPMPPPAFGADELRRMEAALGRTA